MRLWIVEWKATYSNDIFQGYHIVAASTREMAEFTTTEHLKKTLGMEPITTVSMTFNALAQVDGAVLHHSHWYIGGR